MPGLPCIDPIGAMRERFRHTHTHIHMMQQTMRMFESPDIPWNQQHDLCKTRIAHTLAGDNKD